MITKNEKIILLKRYRKILQDLIYMKEANEREENNIHETYIEGKPKVLVLTKKYNGRDIKVA